LETNTQRKIGGALGLALALAAGAAGAQSAFVKVGPETVYDAGDRCGVPTFAVADLNGDGRPDFVLGNTPWSAWQPPTTPGAVMLWIAQPDGSYREQSAQLFAGPVTTAVSYSDLVLADFNGDGVPDIYIPDYGPDNSDPATIPEGWPKVALSTPTGFVDASAQFAGLLPRRIHTGAAADIRGTGTADIYVGSNTGGPVPGKKPYLLLNDGHGNFTFDQWRLPAVVLAQMPEQGARSRQIDASTWYIADERFPGALFADVDRDGYPDLILLQAPLMPNGLVFLNDGHGDFSKRPPIELPPGINGGNWLVGTKNANGGWVFPMPAAPGDSTGELKGRAADLNGDGYPDLVIEESKCLRDASNALQCYQGGYLQILINQAGRGFVDETAARGAPGVDSPNGNYQMSLQIVDVNGDGFPDLVANKLWPYEPHVYLNDGTGRFARTTLPGIPTNSGTTSNANDGLFIVVSSGFGKPTRIVNVRFDWRFNTPRQNVSSCTLRVQTWERPAPVAATANYQGLWWASPANSESGWGINFAHQGDTIFATWFTYDSAGKAYWLSMTAAKTADKTYTGDLIQTSGPPFDAVPFDGSKVGRTKVGTGTLSFTDGDNGSFRYTVGTATQTKAITKQLFGAAPTCAYGASPSLLALANNYQDLWWAAPGGSESGWGVNLTHQGNTIFATWFTYDGDGSPLWLSAIASKQPTGIYSGPLYRTTGPAFSAVPFNASAVQRTVVGNATLRFQHGNSGTLGYTVNGTTQSKSITRQMFSPSAGTYCG